ncbi:hypothetical protein RO3G_10074 [Rhizopus delemar RA 99-880]|uniref:RecF/RecN/SMC N-terminal domain-containing protein n=1 Tax=Rhizopus delemar (strain RA 99-880 / ATCC MYA-4621 / FGSC 9543 / NRRL 43880) TaxID=246409 RepID=I1CA84_RHIO9|nr:hypothetical protein RO3G_10074 [Rhizopus delemar RA 99-880]|eukprot:EIE85364.1 hypothetical protein RO3G_10074 [Rhizopus delemar RA 99-880]
MPYGTIARVEVVNFMCHKYLKVDFGPKINFVVGHNGSGKSAILTALTVALGANASTTNRAKSVSSLIKEGTNFLCDSTASITIHITNGGEYAYKPDIFPDFIIVERKLNREGPSPYKIKNSSNKVISTKKEDLVAILDHMNIMVNNPLVILTQDMARKFLSDSSSEDKYKLFMHGTQLTQLRNDFDSVRESLETARATIERKKQVLPTLLERANEAAKRQQDIQEAKEIDGKIDILNNELVWSQIILKEKEAAAFKRDVEVAEKQFLEAKEKHETEKIKVTQLSESILKVREEWDEFKNGPNPYEEEMNALEKNKEELESKISEFTVDLNNINSDIKRVKKVRDENQQLLAAETAKLEANSRIKRTDIQNEIHQMREKIEHKVEKRKQIDRNQAELKDENKLIQEKKDNLEREAAQKKRQITSLRTLIGEMENQRGNSLKGYGENMPKVLEEIRRDTRWQKRRPVGPFGTTIQLKYLQYANVLESYLGKTLNAFVVECFQDKQILAQILKRNHMDHIPIMVAPYDMFDYSSGEPDEQYLTALRALTFKDEWVKRQMIISSKIECTLLMDNREEADRLMMKRPRNIDLCFTSSGHKVGGKSGMKTDSLQTYRGFPRFQNDIEKQIQEKKREENEMRKEYDEIAAEIKIVDSKINEIKRRYNDNDRLARTLDQEIFKLENEISLKEEEMKEEDPVDLQIYEDDIRKSEEKMKNLAQQFASIKRQRDAVQPELKEIAKKMAIIKKKEDARENLSDEYRRRIEKLERQKEKVIAEVDACKTSYQNIKMRLEARKTQYNESEKLVRQWISDSIDDYPDRVETNRRPAEIEKDISYYEKLAERKVQNIGASVAEIESAAIKAMQEWKDAKTLIEHMEKLCRSLAKMLSQRIERWQLFRDYIGLAAKTYFAYYLQKRGDEGSLKFNHKLKKLDIRVATGDQYSKGTRQKDSRSLSGGEKSYSQISLLLSLWQSISSPIICLDEFDVFMDAVNRKQTMNMIMNAAGDNSSQYILITPQGASNLIPGPYVTIHRLADPERN